MNKFNVIALGLAASASAGLTAHAAPIARIDGALQSQPMVEQVQYRWAGREYCFYDDGWRGPGWYWCGYRLRTGFGWGGPMGWHSWNVEREPRGNVGVVERGGRGTGYVERGGRTVEHRGVTEVRPGMRTQGTVGANERGVTTGRGEIGARTTTGHAGGSVAGGNISGGNVPGGAGRTGGAPTTTGSGAHFGGAAAAGGGRGGGAPGGANRGEH